MDFDSAQRLTEILLALAFLQQSLEHLSAARDEQRLFALRIVLSLLLLFGVQSQWATVGLVILSLPILHRFQGPYNGGSDRMGLLILICLCLSHFAPNQSWKDIALGYLALQLVLSYLISGWVKIVNPDWRSGRALSDVFQFSAYPVSENLRSIARQPRLVLAASWAVMLFEIAFPATLLHPVTLIAGLSVAGLFHLANAVLFGLNRFFWVWLAAYPSILWLQHRVFASIQF
ncbi:HTTM domain-containing protein [Pelagibius litoralis]|uniref:HTTM domain-containing protein n=1 Tax=Pelagibius litoralis TaxID=374515 RepID=A0A967F125_9PROT|nr:HTTM domain-containing protein [Pelagibius litoralis]NIA71109.1 HTTM domain-containing protein [Pelagibius litoralis]